MKDRISTYPGRVKLTPVSGQENVYDLERWDSPTETGTPLSKATLLADAVAEAFGGDSNSTPNDVLEYFSRHTFWKKYNRTYTKTLVAMSDSSSVVNISYKNQATYAVVKTATSSSAVVVNSQTGEITLNSNTTYTFSSSNGTSGLAGKYFQFTTLSGGTAKVFDTNAVYYCSSSQGNTYTSSSPVKWTIDLANVSVVIGTLSTNTLVGTVHALSSSAYPNPSGFSGGYYYECIGKPLEHAVNGAKFEMGTYIGTGTYGFEGGASFSLSSSSQPYLVFITGQKQTTQYDIYDYGEDFYVSAEVCVGVAAYDLTSTPTYGCVINGSMSYDPFPIYAWLTSNNVFHITFVGSANGTEASLSLNAAGATYNYLAITV